MKAWYSKELEDQPLYLNGRAYRFDLLETEDAQLIPLLDACAAKRKGGIVKLTEQQYQEQVKKKLLTPPSLLKQRKREEVHQKVHVRLQSGKRVRAVVEDVKPQTITEQVLAKAGPVDFTQFKPKTSTGVFQ